ncbi:hypothetical protein O6H91_13G073700 [Diphasiastrum complanatum]|uniref:Uncharacterized protein n=1 Tax=Diphasiastrum complanatum TaxID=34168 RepID=A0ACC2BW50_DIPCM|nr:hypothetical protein O6H91_13G073700 [Diphasiastrum complanatum]
MHEYGWMMKFINFSTQAAAAAAAVGIRPAASSVNRRVAELLNERTSYATLASLLKRCSEAKALSDGRLVHAHIKSLNYDRKTFLGNWLVKMYSDCGSMNDAKAVFDSLPVHNLRSWNILIKAYAKNGYGREALSCFHQMQLQGLKPNQITLVSALDACAGLAELELGQEIHASIVEGGYEAEVIVGTALVNMYGKCGRAEEALAVFDKMPQRDVVAWNAIISACALNGNATKALYLFNRMQLCGIKPNQSTFVSALDACAVQGLLDKGKHIHGSIVEGGYEGQVVVATALISMYGKCGSLEEARKVFAKMPHRNVITWNAMIAACAQNGQGKEALDWFDRMQLQRLKPNQITFVCVLDACASLAALEIGQEIHAAITEAGYEGHVSYYDGQVVVGTALVNMYGKCGSVDEARSVFSRMRYRNVISWNAMILACAQNGQGEEALDLFNEMQHQGIKPDHITFLGVLAACSHTGQVDKARQFFQSMSKDHGIAQKVDHYVCLIDILGRAGHLGEAEQFINTMPIENASVWLCLLGACRVHGDVERGVRAANRVIKLDPENAAPYVLLSNILAAAGRWDDAKTLRCIWKTTSSKQQPERCYIEVNKKVHEFIAADISHPQIQDIISELKRLSKQIEEAGLLVDTGSVFHEKDEDIDYFHSVKLAIGFGLICTPPGTTLRITKNAQICSNCHTATKIIAHVVRRKIVIRDANRIHAFEHGSCSCKDYW